MHGVLFQLKRSYLRALRTGQKFCREADRDMTPARYDLLHVVSRWMLGHDTRRGEVPRQSLLARALGVSQVTVSKMLGRLEDLGLIRRRPHPTDRRCKCVTLTQLGLAALRVATRAIVEPGALQVLFQAAFGGPHETPPERAGERVISLYRELLYFARGLRDRAWLRYPLPTILPRHRSSSATSPAASPTPAACSAQAS